MLLHWVISSQMYWSHLQGFSWIRPLKMRPSDCLKTSGTKYPVMWCHIPEERSPHMLIMLQQYVLYGTMRSALCCSNICVVFVVFFPFQHRVMLQWYLHHVTVISASCYSFRLSLIVHPLSHTCNIGSQFTVYNLYITTQLTTYGHPPNIINNNTKLNVQLEVESVTTSRYVYLYI